MNVASLLALVLAFAVFMALVWSVHRLNRYGSEHFGYEPFALPNAALMCIPSLLLLSAMPVLGGLPALHDLFGGEASVAGIKLLIWALFLLAMLALLIWRTNLWVGLYAAVILSVAAPIVLMTVLFGRLGR
jgi:hypothetical protein